MDQRRVALLILLPGLALAACRDSGHLLGESHAGGHGGDAAVIDDGAGGTGGAAGGGQGGHGGAGGRGGAGGIGSGSGGNDGGPDGSVDSGGTCPAQMPGVGSNSCSGSTTCTYGQSTCCGIASSAFTCRCQNGSFLCVMTVECNFTCPDAGVGTDGGHACGATTCAADQVCVRKQTIGGACFSPDAGCPAGYSPGTFGSSPCCVRDPSYACAARPPACGSTLTCDCAAPTLCLGFGGTCATPSTSEIDCTQLVP